MENTYWPGRHGEKLKTLQEEIKDEPTVYTFKFGCFETKAESIIIDPYINGSQYDKTKGFFNDFAITEDVIKNMKGEIYYSSGINKLITKEHISGKGITYFETIDSQVLLEGTVKKKGLKNLFYSNLRMHIAPYNSEHVKEIESKAKIIFNNEIGLGTYNPLDYMEIKGLKHTDIIVIFNGDINQMGEQFKKFFQKIENYNIKNI